MFGVLLVGMMLAAGCSGADAGSSDTSEATGAFPVTIEHVFGSTTVPEKPERIVALGVSDADVVLALGQVPVGNTGFAFYETGLGPWTEGL
ncbi:MAG: iron-siderophore ABC transporter substrate-binding protein, partial [Rhodococcus sp. (in: high G+C Gram-positive bacteria)]